MSANKQTASRRRRQTSQKRLLVLAVVTGISLLLVAFVVIQGRAAAPNPNTNLLIGPTAAYPSADGLALGPADAPVVVMEFADFQCPYCGLFHADIQDQLIERYVATGQVRFEFHHYIVIDNNVGGSESRHAAIASECANEQGAFWPFHALLFANQQGEGQGGFSDSRLRSLAQALDLDLGQFNGCFTSSAAAAAVTADEQLAQQFGLYSVPSLLVNGQRLANPLDFQLVSSAIDIALNSAQ
jgi:protein-disulfide isomerase